MARLRSGTWVVVADGEKALILENVTDAASPNLRVLREFRQDNPPAREQAADKPGRYPGGSVGQRSAVENTDWHELAKERFAKSLAETLYKSAHKGKIKRLVLVAPPDTLGVLRGSLHPEVAALVRAEIDKTLTNHPVGKIETIVARALDEAG